MKLRDIRKRSKTSYVVEEGFRWVRGFVSPRCRTDEPGCGRCDYWHFYRTNGRFPTWGVDDYMREVEGGDL